MPPTFAAARNIASGRVSRHPALDLGLAASGRASARSTVRISQSSRCEPAHQRAADHAAMAGDPDALACDRSETRRAHSRHSRPLRPSARPTVEILVAPSPRTSSAKSVSCVQPSFLRALRRIAEQQVDLGRPEIARVDLDQHPRRSRRRCPSRSTPLPCQSIVHARLGEGPLDELAHRCASRRSPARSRPARPAAASATCRRHSRGHGPSRAWRRDCRDRARSCRPSSIAATARVILRVTKVSPRIGLSWLNRMPFEACMP